MAANLARMADGKVAMAAWGRVPVWHGTGQRSDELMEVEQAAQESGLFYDVDVLDQYINTPYGQIQGRGRQIVRTDTWDCLGQCGVDYKPIQNRDVCGLLNPFIKSGQVKGIMTAGVIGKGEKAWMQAVVGDFGPTEFDRGISTLLLLMNHDASGAVKVGFTGIYVVCGNTFAMAESDLELKSNYLSQMHVGNVEGGLRRIQASLDLLNKRVLTHEELARKLIEVRITDPRIVYRMAIASVFPSDTTYQDWKAGAQTARRYWMKHWQGIIREYFSGPGADMPTRKSTAFGAWQAAVAYVDYERNPRAHPAQRFRSAMLGEGARIKARALTACFENIAGGREFNDRVLEIERMVPMDEVLAC